MYKKGNLRTSFKTQNCQLCFNFTVRLIWRWDVNATLAIKQSLVRHLWNVQHWTMSNECCPFQHWYEKMSDNVEITMSFWHNVVIMTIWNKKNEKWIKEILIIMRKIKFFSFNLKEIKIEYAKSKILILNSMKIQLLFFLF